MKPKSDLGISLLKQSEDNGWKLDIDCCVHLYRFVWMKEGLKEPCLQELSVKECGACHDIAL